MVLLFFGLLSVLVYDTAHGFQLSGTVVDTNGQPVGNAIVRIQGTARSTSSDPKGFFTLTTDADHSGHITAWKSGFYNGGQAITAKEAGYSIVLRPLFLEDNVNYQWITSRQKENARPAEAKTEAKTCEICHPLIVEEWKSSSHANSASNPLFLAFYNGTDMKGSKPAGPGYRLDFPNSKGNCSTCHVPASAIGSPFSADPNDASRFAKEGIACDLCHKIDHTVVDASGGYPGVLSIRFRRPPEGRQLFYGPYDDVFPGDDSFHPLFRHSNYCAPCHNGKFWDVLAYSEFQEWAASDYAKKGVHCQDCHMKSSSKPTRFALEEKGGNLRDPLAIHSHVNYGIMDKAFMTESIQLETKAVLQNQIVTVNVTVRNANAGHAYPTGNPMRNMLLLIEAKDDRGKVLPLMKGEVVPLWGGVGDRARGNYAGLPGKGFAKVLRDAVPYAADGSQQRHFKRDYPAAHWRPAVIESDNRIAAGGSDGSTYLFESPKTPFSHIRVTARLIYRRAYKTWIDAKGLDLPDMEIAQKTLLMEGKNE